jgi:hypothetical protein
VRTRSRTFLVIGTALLILFASWVIAWLLPAPRICKSIDCGRNFNPDQVTWHPLGFWTWTQLSVVLLGLVASICLVVLGLRAADHDARSAD